MLRNLAISILTPILLANCSVHEGRSAPQSERLRAYLASQSTGQFCSDGSTTCFYLFPYEFGETEDGRFYEAYGSDREHYLISRLTSENPRLSGFREEFQAHLLRDTLAYKMMPQIFSPTTENGMISLGDVAMSVEEFYSDIVPYVPPFSPICLNQSAEEVAAASQQFCSPEDHYGIVTMSDSSNGTCDVAMLIQQAEFSSETAIQTFFESNQVIDKADTICDNLGDKIRLQRELEYEPARSN